MCRCAAIGIRAGNPQTLRVRSERRISHGLLPHLPFPSPSGFPEQIPHRDILFGPVTIATSCASPSAARPLEAPTARCDSRGCPAEAHLRPHAEGAGLISSTSLLQLARVSGCRGPRTRSGTWDLRTPAAAGGRPGSMCRLPEACWSMPEPLRHRRPCVPCRRRPSTLLKASPVEKGAAGTLFGSWRRSSTRLLERGTRWSDLISAPAALLRRRAPGGAR